MMQMMQIEKVSENATDRCKVSTGDASASKNMVSNLIPSIFGIKFTNF